MCVHACVCVCVCTRVSACVCVCVFLIFVVVSARKIPWESSQIERSLEKAIRQLAQAEGSLCPALCWRLLRWEQKMETTSSCSDWLLKDGSLGTANPQKPKLPGGHSVIFVSY